MDKDDIRKSKVNKCLDILNKNDFSHFDDFKQLIKTL
jgi:hypothetical protein